MPGAVRGRHDLQRYSGHSCHGIGAIAAKTYCAQAYWEVTDTALQLFGGKGLSRGTVIEKLYRDARACLIEDGANEVLMLVGAQQLLNKCVEGTGTQKRRYAW